MFERLERGEILVQDADVKPLPILREEFQNPLVAAFVIAQAFIYKKMKSLVN